MRDKTSPFPTQNASAARGTKKGPSRYVALSRRVIGIDAVDVCKLHPTARLVALTIGNALNHKSGRWHIGYDALAKRCGLARATVARHAKQLCHGPDALFMRRRIPTENGHTVYEYAWLDNVHAFRQTDARRTREAVDTVRAFCGLPSSQKLDAYLQEPADAWRRKYMVLRAAGVAGDVPVQRAARELSQLLGRALKAVGLPRLPAREVFGVEQLSEVFDPAYKGPAASTRDDGVRDEVAAVLRRAGIDYGAS